MKNKILSILYIFTILSFILINNCFAITFKNDSEIYTIELPFDVNEHPDFLILKFTNGKGYQVLFPAGEYDLPFYRTSGDGIQYYLKGSTTYGQWNYYNYTISSDSWSEMKTTIQCEAKIYSNGSHVSDVIYSNTDIILKSDSSIFFQRTPVTGTLALELETIQVQEMWKTLMKNVVISLLAFVVSYLALRKAWSFLRIQLKGS